MVIQGMWSGRGIAVYVTAFLFFGGVVGCAEKEKQKALPNTPLAVMEARGYAMEKQTLSFEDPKTGVRTQGTFVTKVSGTAVEMYSVDGYFPEVAADVYQLPSGWRNILWQGSGGTVLIQR